MTNNIFRVVERKGGRIYIEDSTDEAVYFLRAASNIDFLIEALNKTLITIPGHKGELVLNKDKSIFLGDSDEFSFKGHLIARFIDGRIVRLSSDNGVLTQEDELIMNTTKQMGETTMEKTTVTTKAAPKEKPKAAPKAAPKEKPAKIDHGRKKLFKSFQARINYLSYMDHPNTGLSGIEDLGWILTYRNEAGKTYKASLTNDGVLFHEGTKLVMTKTGRVDVDKVITELGWTA